MDRIDASRRSANMARITSKDTSIEILVRSLAHRLGYRFRLHRKDLPGSPDLVFPTKRKAIFVHGCFWHRHRNCRLAYTPKSNKSFWEKKFASNIQRDAATTRELQNMNWSVLVIWECETRDVVALTERIDHFLGHIAVDCEPTRSTRRA
jgi:DNA mismatch endonuclease (patch repair protein)